VMLNTGAECVGTYSPVCVAQGEELDIAENKKKARKSAAAKVFAHLKSNAEFRYAVHLSEQARAKAKQDAAAAQQQQEGPGTDNTLVEDPAPPLKPVAPVAPPTIEDIEVEE
jgi:hypothetical protein